MFTPVLAKHSKSFSLIDCISVGVDRMQRNFEPMCKQVEAWQKSELTDVTAKVVIYEAFVRPYRARSVFRTAVRRVPAENDLESVERIHFSIQGPGAHPTVQGDSQAGGIPGGPVLRIVLALRGGLGIDRSFLAALLIIEKPFSVSSFFFVRLPFTGSNQAPQTAINVRAPCV